MEEARVYLADEIRLRGKEDGEEMNAVVEMVFYLVDACWDEYLLFGQAFDIIAVYSASAIGGLQR